MSNNFFFPSDIRFNQAGPFTTSHYARSILDVHNPGNENSFFRERSELNQELKEKSFIDQDGCCEKSLPDNAG
jgi:hypothetical protein